MEQEKKKLVLVREKNAQSTGTIRKWYTYGHFTIGVEEDMEGNLPTSLWAENSVIRELELKAFSGEGVVLSTRMNLCVTTPEEAMALAGEVTDAAGLMELIPGIMGEK